MTNAQPHKNQVIDQSVREKIYKALLVYFINENNRLGTGIKEELIIQICRALLKGSEEERENFWQWKAKEESILADYHKKELEIMDYLHLVSLETRKQFGQFPTPITIVRYIFSSVGYTSSKDILQKKLIDPACGSGAFLVEAARIYLDALKNAGIPLHKWYPMVIEALCGIDFDTTACFFARMNLLTLLAPTILAFAAKNDVERIKPLPVYCADTLKLFALDRKKALPLYVQSHIPLLRRFDFVVGNPPYLKIKGLDRDLKTAFSESIYGHPNAYGLFIHAGIEMLKHRGRLGFIVPRSMLSGLYFKNLRGLIEKKTAIREIGYISERKKVFDDVLHGTMILSLESVTDSSGMINVSFIESLNDFGKTTVAVQPESVIQRLNGSTVWFVADDEGIYTVIKRIVARHPLLSSPEVNCPAKTGQIVWNRVKPLLAVKPVNNTLPLIWATDVGKFSFSFNKMAAARPCYLKVAAKTENLIVKGPAILVQRITADEQPSRIVADLPWEFCRNADQGYFVENHLNLIQPAANDSRVDLYFLLGVLNSEIVDFFFRAMNGNTQVSATELNLLPIPIGKHEREIAQCAKKIHKGPADARKNDATAELNRLVAKAYGVGMRELEFIRKYLKTRFQKNGKTEAM